MQPIPLNDDQMTAVLAAATLLPFNRRAVFLAEVASALNQLPEIGDGALHRVIMEVQRRHYDPPLGRT
jgi:hypothetical protein